MSETPQEVLEKWLALDPHPEPTLLFVREAIRVVLAERDELRAEVERLRAGWEKAAEVGRQNIRSAFECQNALTARAEKAEAALRPFAALDISGDEGTEAWDAMIRQARAALRDTAPAEQPRIIMDESAPVPPEMWEELLHDTSAKQPGPAGHLSFRDWEATRVKMLADVRRSEKLSGADMATRINATEQPEAGEP